MVDESVLSKSIHELNDSTDNTAISDIIYFFMAIGLKFNIDSKCICPLIGISCL